MMSMGSREPVRASPTVGSMNHSKVGVRSGVWRRIARHMRSVAFIERISFEREKATKKGGTPLPVASNCPGRKCVILHNYGFVSMPGKTGRRFIEQRKSRSASPLRHSRFALVA